MLVTIALCPFFLSDHIVQNMKLHFKGFKMTWLTIMKYPALYVVHVEVFAAVNTTLNLMTVIYQG